MTSILNLAAMALTIAFGLIGFLAPGYTMEVLGLMPVPGETMGFSEIRAANGALFVGLGLAGVILRQRPVFLTVGAAYAGAAAGRLTGVLVDGSGPQAAMFFIVEAGLALWLILANRPQRPAPAPEAG